MDLVKLNQAEVRQIPSEERDFSLDQENAHKACAHMNPATKAANPS